MQERLTPMGGEFVAREREASFRDEHVGETLRHMRLIFVLSAVLNTLFLFSDWRFAGTPHFYVAVPARAVLILASLAAFMTALRLARLDRAEAVMIVWLWVCAFAVAALVSARTDIALFVVILLPSSYYLVMPIPARWTFACGIGCSVLMLAGYLAPDPLSPTAPGMILAMAVLNVALALVVMRTNRTRRLEWAATQAERLAREELADSRRALRKLFMAVPVPLIVVEIDTGRLVEANDTAYTYFGETLSQLGSTSIEQVYVNPADRTAILAMLRERGHVDAFETRVRLADGSVHHVLLASSLISIDGKPHTVTGVVDISRHKEVEAHLDRLAGTDQLTGLPNRTRFLALARAEIERAARHRRPVAVMMFDLDHFKRLNDAHGHAAGDAALKAFAGLCQATLRANDVAARLGGEEFAALLPETTAANALTLAERLRAETERLVIAGAPEGLRLTVSIGIAELHPGETSIEAGLARADAALYAAKRAGRNRVRSQEPPRAA